MNPLNLIKLLKPRKNPISLEIIITPKIEAQLQNLGLTKDHYLYELAARTLQMHSDSFETLKRMSEESLKNNHGGPYHMIEKYGTQKVSEILDEYGNDSSVYLNKILSAIDNYGEDTVAEVSSKFGLKNLSTIAPHYSEYGEGLTRKIIDEWGDKGFLLYYVFPIYRGLQEAKEKSNNKETKQYKIIFKGEVQDVGFRDTSKNYAEICKLSGTIMNLDDGSVLCEVQGLDPLVDVFILGLKKDFKVRKVIKKETKLNYQTSDFRVI